MASRRVHNLHNLRRAHFFGNAGGKGYGMKCDGVKAKPIKFKVPIGTEIYKVMKSDPTHFGRSLNKEHLQFLADLNEEEKEFLAAKGGIGGKGNYNHREIMSTDKGKIGE